MKISSIAETIILPNLNGQRKPSQKYAGFGLHERKNSFCLLSNRIGKEIALILFMMK
jgi:hypothetical protein